MAITFIQTGDYISFSNDKVYINDLYFKSQANDKLILKYNTVTQFLNQIYKNYTRVFLRINVFWLGSSKTHVTCLIVIVLAWNNVDNNTTSDTLDELVSSSTHQFHLIIKIIGWWWQIMWSGTLNYNKQMWRIAAAVFPLQFPRMKERYIYSNLFKILKDIMKKNNLGASIAKHISDISSIDQEFLNH